MSAVRVSAGREEQVSHGVFVPSYPHKLVVFIVAAVVERVEVHATSSQRVVLMMLVQEEEVERNGCSILRGCQIAQKTSRFLLHLRNRLQSSMNCPAVF